MKFRLLILFSFLLVLPIGLILWYGQKSFISEQKLLQAESSKAGDAILEESHLKVSSFLSEIKTKLSHELLKVNWNDGANFDVDFSDQPLIKQVFVSDKKGRLLFPMRDDTSNPLGIEFIKRTANLWLNQSFKSELLSKLSISNKTDGTIGKKVSYSQASVWGTKTEPNDGFLTWYWEEGLNLLYWCEHPSGYIVGTEVNFAYLKARLIGQLPNRLIHAGTVQLINSRQSVIYQWGDYEIKPKMKPLAHLRVQYPLDSWTIQYFTRSQESLGRLKKVYDLAFNTNLIFLVTLVLIISAWVGVYLWKDMKVIEKRMNFVTNVSHELKTPLTNIRLYSELLGRMELMNEKQKNYLSIIVKESERLSRLIQNVLTFNKDKTKQKFLITSVDINDLIQTIVSQEEPYLVQLGFQVELKLNTDEKVLIDRDSIIQVVSNLISNVEKYAKEGLFLGVTIRAEKGFVLIDFVDKGPGIPATLKAKIFTPFFRINNQLSDGVAGTGIGLTISKELAISNGGDLTCEDCLLGSCFRLKLKIDKEV